MTSFIAGLIYKSIGLMIGGGFGVMGYLLLAQGIFDKSELSVVWGNRSLLLKRATPGTLFALFGVVVICTMILKPINVEENGNVYKTAFRPDDVMQPLQAWPATRPQSVPLAMQRLIEGGDVTTAERTELMKWYIESEGTYMPFDVRGLIKSALVAGNKLTESQQYKVKAWMTDPESFGSTETSVPK